MTIILGKRLIGTSGSIQTRHFTHDASVHFAKGVFRGAFRVGVFFVGSLVVLAGFHVYNESKISTEVRIQREKLKELEKFVTDTKSKN
jgi:hypothetical protein